MDREAWHAPIHGVTMILTQLSDWTELNWYTSKMDKLEEMGRFLEKFNFPRLNQEEIEIMNKPITCTEIENVILKTPKKLKHKAR